MLRMIRRTFYAARIQSQLSGEGRGSSVTLGWQRRESICQTFGCLKAFWVGIVPLPWIKIENKTNHIPTILTTPSPAGRA